MISISAARTCGTFLAADWQAGGPIPTPRKACKGERFGTFVAVDRQLPMNRLLLLNGGDVLHDSYSFADLWVRPMTTIRMV
jgi:hypothetical protein